MNTPTRKAAPDETSRPDLLNLGIPRPARIPSRCGPVEAVPVSAASPWEACQAAGRAINHARQAFGADSDEYRAAVAKAEELSAPYKATKRADEPSETDEDESDEPTPYVGSETWAENWIDHCERIGVKP